MGRLNAGQFWGEGWGRGMVVGAIGLAAAVAVVIGGSSVSVDAAAVPVGQDANGMLTGGDGVAAQTTPYTITLAPRWSLVGYAGPNNADIVDSLEGTAAEGRVTAIYRWIGEEQRWEGWFLNGQGIPGANDFSTLQRSVAYWIAITGNTNVTWTFGEE